MRTDRNAGASTATALVLLVVASVACDRTAPITDEAVAVAPLGEELRGREDPETQMAGSSTGGDARAATAAGTEGVPFLSRSMLAPDDAVWIAGGRLSGAGLVAVDPAVGQVVGQIDLRPVTNDGSVYGLRDVVVSDGSVWVLVEDDGADGTHLVQFDRRQGGSGSSWTFPHAVRLLSSPGAVWIVQDANWGFSSERDERYENVVLTRLDTATEELRSAVLPVRQANDVAYHDGSLWLASSSQILEVAEDGLEVTATIEHHAANLVAGDGWLWTEAGGHLDRVRLGTNQPAGLDLEVADTAISDGGALAFGSGSLWAVADEEPDAIVQIDPETTVVVRRVGSEFNVRDLHFAHGSLWALGTSLDYSTEELPTTLLEVDPSSGEIVSRVALSDHAFEHVAG